MNTADRGIQSREEHILLENFFIFTAATVFHQFVQKSGFSCICIADQCDGRKSAFQTSGTLYVVSSFDCFQFPGQLGDPCVDMPAVQLQLGLTDTTVGHTAGCTSLAP